MQRSRNADVWVEANSANNTYNVKYNENSFAPLIDLTIRDEKDIPRDEWKENRAAEARREIIKFFKKEAKRN